MAATEALTTIGDAAAEFGMNRDTFRRRFLKLGIIPSIRIPHSPMGKGFTPAQMDRLREHLGAEAREKATA